MCVSAYPCVHESVHLWIRESVNRCICAPSEPRVCESDPGICAIRVSGLGARGPRRAACEATRVVCRYAPHRLEGGRDGGPGEPLPADVLFAERDKGGGVSTNGVAAISFLKICFLTEELLGTPDDSKHLKLHYHSLNYLNLA